MGQMKTGYTSKSFYFATISAVALIHGAASAQTAPASDSSVTGAAQDVAPTALDVVDPTPTDSEIVVTGSRIARPEIDSPSPVVSISSATLEQSGRTNLTDFLVQNPALLGSTTSANQSGSTASFGGAGTNLLNLRNLGSNRTLVLVDGRRHVAGLPGTAAVDINTIPKDLIESTEILTGGGGSAIYGADGVSGVVNFKLKRDFEGLRVRGQAGATEDGDAGNRFFAITGGKNFADGRGNVALSYEFTDDDRLSSFRRDDTGDPLKTYSFARHANTPALNAGPDRILQNNLRYADSSRNGAIDVDFDGLPDFTGDGTVYNRGLLLPGGLTQGGDSTPLAGYQGDFQPQNRIHNINLLTSFQVSPALRLFAQGKYANTKSYTIAQPSFDFFTFLAPDNAYLNDRFGALASDGALLSRDNYDLGVRGESTKRETLRGVIGADGQISDHAKYELSYVYGQTKSRFLSTNYRLADRYYAALDAVRDPSTGQIVCRSNLDPAGLIDPNNYGQAASTFTPGANSGCQPLNVLGDGVVSQAALDFINVDLVNRYKVQQHVLSGSISGDFGQFFELPGGPIAFAFGGEYRKEKSAFNSDTYAEQGALLDLAQVLPEKGSFDVKEAFGELSAPLLKGMRFAELLSFDAAIRLSDYSTVGRTTTYSLGGVYAPIRDFRVRGTYSQAVRAPNITELFSPTNGTFSFIDDPCDAENLPEGTQYRVANCQATLTAAGLSPAQIAAFNPVNDPSATVSLPGRAGGNRNLLEETAKTWTVGVVLQPRFLPRLTITADWFNVKLKNAVRTASAQELVDLCVDQPSLDNVYCANVTRSGTTGYVSDYFLAPQNVAAFRTSGLDLSLTYTIDVSPEVGAFSLRVNGNYLDKLTFVPTPGAEVEDSRLLPSAPKYSGQTDLTWTNGPLTLNYGLTYQSKTRRFTVDQITANPNYADPQYFFYRERWEHDIQASVRAGDRFSFYGGVNNLSGKIGDVGNRTGIGTPYNVLGRVFYAGARMSLDKLF